MKVGGKTTGDLREKAENIDDIHRKSSAMLKHYTECVVFRSCNWLEKKERRLTGKHSHTPENKGHNKQVATLQGTRE